MGKAWSGHPDYPLRYEWPEEDEIRPEPVPSMTSVFEYEAHAFHDTDAPRQSWWRRLLRFFR